MEIYAAACLGEAFRDQEPRRPVQTIESRSRAATGARAMTRRMFIIILAWSALCGGGCAVERGDVTMVATAATPLHAPSPLSLAASTLEPTTSHPWPASSVSPTLSSTPKTSLTGGDVAGIVILIVIVLGLAVVFLAVFCGCCACTYAAKAIGCLARVTCCCCCVQARDKPDTMLLTDDRPAGVTLV